MSECEFCGSPFCFGLECMEPDYSGMEEDDCRKQETLADRKFRLDGWVRECILAEDIKEFIKNILELSFNFFGEELAYKEFTRRIKQRAGEGLLK